MRTMSQTPNPEAARRRPSDGLDVRYHGSDPGDIGLTGKLGLVPTTRVTILVSGSQL